MILYKNGRFHFGKLSVCIPDGTFLNMNPNVIHGGLTLCRPDQTAVLDIYVDTGFLDSRSALEEIIRYMENVHQIGEIESVCQNGLTGSKAIYMTSKESYFELRFDYEEDKERKNFVLTLMTKCPLSLEFVLTHPDLLYILHSVQEESEPKNNS